MFKSFRTVQFFPEPCGQGDVLKFDALAEEWSHVAVSVASDAAADSGDEEVQFGVAGGEVDEASHGLCHALQAFHGGNGVAAPLQSFSLSPDGSEALHGVACCAASVRSVYVAAEDKDFVLAEQAYVVGCDAVGRLVRCLLVFQFAGDVEMARIFAQNEERDGAEPHGAVEAGKADIVGGAARGAAVEQVAAEEALVVVQFREGLVALYDLHFHSRLPVAHKFQQGVCAGHHGQLCVCALPLREVDKPAAIRFAVECQMKRALFCAPRVVNSFNVLADYSWVAEDV